MLRALTITVVVAATVSGCAGPDTSGPERVAVSFSNAITNGDGVRACALLSPQTAAAVAEASRSACPDAVLHQDLPAATPLRSVQRYGKQALVRSATDTMFLSEFPTGWKIIGAGCRPQGERPYDCGVSKG